MTCDGCYIKRAEVSLAKSAVGRAVTWHGMGLQDASCGGEDVDHAAGAADFPARRGDDIAIDVEAHAINAAMGIEVVEDTVLPQCAVLLDGIGAQFAQLTVAIL